MTERPCYSCETGTVRPADLFGRTLDYREVRVVFDRHLVVPTCDSCRDFLLRGTMTAEFNATMERLRQEALWP